MDSQHIQDALRLFDLREPVTKEALHQRYRELRALWTPHRYANLTNSPQQYMKMYKKAEAKLHELEAAYRQLLAWIERSKP